MYKYTISPPPLSCESRPPVLKAPAGLTLKHFALLRAVILGLTACTLIGICCCSAGTQPPDDNDTGNEPSDPFQQNDKLGRGINLGNALEAPAEGEWGVTLEAEYFRLIKEVGFNSVRIPIRWSAHAQLDSPYTIETSFLNRVNWAIIQALSNGLMVMINIHHYQEINEFPAQHKARLLGLWQQIAFHFQAYSDSLLFEVLNEPHDALTPSLWNEYLAEAIVIIRDANPNRTLVIGTANWGGRGSLAELEIPQDENNTIVTFHYYDPFQFTHQGAEWAEGSDAWLGTTWDGTINEMAAIRSDFEGVRDWGIEHQRPIFLGEFGAYSKADMDSRVRWTAFVAREAESKGMSWAYWEFCSGFGIYDAANSTWNTALRDALLAD